MMAKAVFPTPSRSTKLCNGRVRWLLPAAVMTALLISTVFRFYASDSLTNPHECVNRARYGTLRRSNAPTLQRSARSLLRGTTAPLARSFHRLPMGASRNALVLYHMHD